ncbi:MAG: universal stress protein [Lewinellaceae bacterium]|nr:universal stress protein [Saprospiraceae bacterium]MCB9340096.1 universal stress protein [Lewinellaceae bacterium]
MNKILVPTDFSENAGFAADTAIAMAHKTNSQVIFMHGFVTWVDWAHLTKGKEKMYPEIHAQIQAADKSLDDLLAKAASQGVKAVKTLSFIQDGRSLAKRMDEVEHDFMVLGSHGIDGFKKYTLGSNTSKILRLSKKPVLVIQKALAMPLTFKHIVFASGLEPDTHNAFEMLIQFAQSMGAENVHLIEVTTPNNFQPTSKVREEMKMFVAKHHFPKLKLHNVNHFSIEAGILEFVKENNADLVGIANHGRTDISSLFIESIPENLVKYSDLPVLSIRV